MKSKAIKNVILYSTLFVILIIFLVFILPNLRGNNENNTESSSDKGGSKIENTTNCYPIEGKDVATDTKPIKAYLDPEKTTAKILGEGNAKFVFEQDPSKFFICDQKDGTYSKEKIAQWNMMPKGNYLVYADSVDKIIFSWHQ